MAPHLQLSSYGCWGQYVLGASTLGAAVECASSAIGYHSQGDSVAVFQSGKLARIVYSSAARGRDGYVHVACGVVGVILGVCRCNLPPGWRSLRIELDVPRQRNPRFFEAAFACPVRFEGAAVAVVFEAGRLSGPRAPHLKVSLTTIEDVARARLAPETRGDLAGVAATQIWAQVLAGAASIDSAARALDTSIRTLRRALNRAGTDFRASVNAARSRRAIALLRGSDVSITELSLQLGYSSPAHFTRAFRRSMGSTPRDFRRMFQG